MLMTVINVSNECCFELEVTAISNCVKKNHKLRHVIKQVVNDIVKLQPLAIHPG